MTIGGAVPSGAKLQGCLAQGKSAENALARFREATELHFETLSENERRVTLGQETAATGWLPPRAGAASGKTADRRANRLEPKMTKFAARRRRQAAASSAREVGSLRQADRAQLAKSGAGVARRLGLRVRRDYWIGSRTVLLTTLLTVTVTW